MIKSAGIALRPIPFFLVLKARRVAICVTTLVFLVPTSLYFCFLPSGSTLRARLSGVVCLIVRFLILLLEFLSLFEPGPTVGFGW